jgi:hypothetical protein
MLLEAYKCQLFLIKRRGAVRVSVSSSAAVSTAHRFGLPARAASPRKKFKVRSAAFSN